MTTTMLDILKKQKQAFIAEGHVSAETRIARLTCAYRMIGENQQALVDACNADFGNRSKIQSQMSEVLAVMTNFDHSIKQVRQWMKAKKRPVMFPLNLMGSRARVEYVPKGVIGVLGTWNFPVYTALSPVAGILAAGNRCLVKVSELNPATGAVLQQLIAKYFDESEVAVVTGGPEVGAEFAALPLDHIIFTGGTHIGRHILQAAAKNLTPCTLELGGKSPVIVGRSYDIKKAAERIMAGKQLNQGQACLAPDYVFVPSEHKQIFIDSAVNYYRQLFPNVLNNPDYTSVINERHQKRLLDYISDAKQKGAQTVEINPANEDFSKQAAGVHKIPMTLIVDPTDDMLCMQEELFGPVLCIKTYQKLDECIRYINEHPRPLGLYYFGNDAAEERYVLDHTISGGVALNDVMAHSSCEDLPFGGIGNSGMGAYHGYDGFRTFSHPRAIYKQTGLDMLKLAGMLPPYTDKCKKQLDMMCKVKH
jgi:coniferyl-aldehyde dehydrogenase